MLCLEDFCVTYPDGTQAVNHVNLTLHAGEAVALIGANGAGKTSLMLAMMGVLPAAGSLVLDELSLCKENLRALRQKMGMVFQNPDDQLFMAKIEEDVAFGLRNAGVPEAEVAERVAHCMDALGIAPLRTKTALKLSGGEKRMAALASVLVMEPSVMLLDEPSAFLDPRARRTLIGTLNTLPHTKLIATHDLRFARDTCSRVVLFQKGAIFADGPTALLYDAALMEACGVEAID